MFQPIPRQHLLGVHILLLLAAATLVSDIIEACTGCIAMTEFHTVIAAAGTFAYAVLTFVGWRGQRTLFYSGIVLAGGIHAFLLGSMFVMPQFCLVCAVIAVACLLLMALALGQRAIRLSLATAIFAAALSLSALGFWELQQLEANRRSQRVARFHQMLSAQTKPANEAQQTAPSLTNPDQPALAVTVIERENCYYCRLFREVYVPKLEANFGQKIKISFVPAKLVPGVQRTPTIVIERGPVFEGVGRYEELHQAVWKSLPVDDQWRIARTHVAPGNVDPVVARSGAALTGPVAALASLSTHATAVTASRALGWQILPNTQLKSVCPPNNFQPAGGGMLPYNFSDMSYSIITAWNGAIADTKRNRLIIWGGGHSAYLGNDVYSLELVAPTPAVKAQSQAAAPRMARLTDPSVFTLACPQPVRNADGTPIQRHTYNALVYLPKADKMFAWNGPDMCPTQQYKNVWLLDMNSMSWEEKLPGGYDVASLYGSPIAACVLDPTTAHESVVCLWGSTMLLRYNVDGPAANTWNLLGTVYSSTGWPAQLTSGCTGVVDPIRKLLFLIGPDYTGNLGTGRIYTFDLTNPTANPLNWTSQVSGCDALLNAPYPGLVYDPTLNKIVGYPNTGDTVYLFDPGTKSCTTKTFANGPTPPVPQHGTFGRFNYFPALNKYVMVGSASADAYTLQLSDGAPPPPPPSGTTIPGLGASTLTCLDKDGDRYGTGPGCLGADADDDDALIRSAEQAIAKYGTLNAFLAHRGYNPARIWYIAPASANPPGDNSTGVVNDVSHPYLTWVGIYDKVAAGDMVMLRSGAYTFGFTGLNKGTTDKPLVFISYPGEQAEFVTRGSGFDFVGVSNFVLDGMRFYANGSNAGVTAGNNTNAIFRRIDSSGNQWGLVASNTQNVIIEESVFHDNPAEHGIYLANHKATPSNNVIVRRNILYNNGYTGFQFNGRVTNLLLEQNLSYSNGLSGFSWLTGVSHSIFRSNVAFNNGQAGLTIYNYTAFCQAYDPTGVGSTCPYDQNNNLIENFTVYNTGKDRDGVSMISSQAAIKVGNTSLNKVGDLGHNTFRNIVASVPGAGNQYQPIVYVDADKDYLATSVFDHILFNQLDTGDGAGTAVIGFGYSSNFGYNPFSCAQAQTLTTLTNCVNADPKFISASINYWNSPSSFDLRLQSSSPAVGAGAALGAARYDVIGNLFANPPSMGAYEYLLPDLTAPTAMSVLSTTVTSSSATITWLTDEPANTQVEYGLTTDYGLTSPLNASWTATHSVQLTGLKRNTLYHFRVLSSDASGNQAKSADFVFRTLKRLPRQPSVRNLSATDGPVILSWAPPVDDDGAEYELTAGTLILRSTTGFAATIDDMLLKAAELAPPFAQWHDPTANSGTTYYYTVFAYDDLGDYSHPATVSLTPKAPTGDSDNGNPGKGGGGGGRPALEMKVKKLRAAVSFDTPGSDRCTLTGRIPSLPLTFVPGLAQVELNIGGAQASFVLDRKGSARSVQGSFKLGRQSKVPGKGVSFRVQLKNGAWSNVWINEELGLRLKTNKVTAVIYANLLLNGELYQTRTTGMWSAAGKSGGNFNSTTEKMAPSSQRNNGQLHLSKRLRVNAVAR